MWKKRSVGRPQPADVTLPNCFHAKGRAAGAKQSSPPTPTPTPDACCPSACLRGTTHTRFSVDIPSMKAGNVRASGPQVAAEVGDPLKRGAETEEEQQSATNTPLLFQHRGGLTAVNSQKGHKNTHRHPDTHTHTRGRAGELSWRCS